MSRKYYILTVIKLKTAVETLSILKCPEKKLTGLYYTCIASKFWQKFMHLTGSSPGAWTSTAETV